MSARRLVGDVRLLQESQGGWKRLRRASKRKRAGKRELADQESYQGL